MRAKKKKARRPLQRRKQSAGLQGAQLRLAVSTKHLPRNAAHELEQASVRAFDTLYRALRPYLGGADSYWEYDAREARFAFALGRRQLDALFAIRPACAALGWREVRVTLSAYVDDVIEELVRERLRITSAGVHTTKQKPDQPVRLLIKSRRT